MYLKSFINFLEKSEKLKNVLKKRYGPSGKKMKNVLKKTFLIKRSCKIEKCSQKVQLGPRFSITLKMFSHTALVTTRNRTRLFFLLSIR